MKKIHLFLSKLLFVLIFCFGVTQSAVITEDIIIPENLIIYPDDQGVTAKSILIEAIRSSKTSIQMSIYQIKDPDIIQALSDQAIIVVIQMAHPLPNKDNLTMIFVHASCAAAPLILNKLK